MTASFAERIARLAADRTSGASVLVAVAVEILRDAREGQPDEVPAVAAGIVRAQPSMASVWNAALTALADRSDPGRLDRFAARLGRSSAALEKSASALVLGTAARPHIVTISASRSVEVVCAAVHRLRAVRVSCAESRPALEGRGVASRLAAAGIEVSLFSDAAIGLALPDADMLLLGADAVAANGFLNKSGSRLVAAAAAQLGVPVYVAASRDKFCGPAVAARLIVRHGAPEEIWDSPPAGVAVRNPCFEWTPLDLVTAVIADPGLLGVQMVPDVCRGIEDALMVSALERLAMEG